MEMKRIAIIGAGISGLTVARMLQPDFDVTIYESEEKAAWMELLQKVQAVMEKRRIQSIAIRETENK